MNGPSITNADDRSVIDLIEGAQRRLLLLVPGVTKSVADAVCRAWNRLGTNNVNVIIDVDAEVCRLGYGTLEGLNVLRLAAAHAETLVCHQPGVRIGLLVSDDTTLIFSPTPLLIEAGSTQPQRPNAIRLDSVPTNVANDVGLGEDPIRNRIVGLDSVRSSQIETVEQDLAAAPPVKFDLARRVRVFTSRFQFVELEMTGCYVSRKKVPIPSSLVGLAKDHNVQSQFHAHFNLVPDSSLEVKQNKRTLTEVSLRKKKDAIIRDFLVHLKSYGSVVLRANKDRLTDAVDALKTDVEAFQKGIKTDLQKHMNTNAAALIEALLPAVIRSPPDAYTKIHGHSMKEATLRKLLAEDIKSVFGTADSLVQEMKVSLIFKDLAYESLVDEEFMKIAREAMPGLECLHEEYEAAKGDRPLEITQ